MHIHAQTQVELDRKAVRVFSGSDQHVAITTSITISISTSILKVNCACVGLGVGFDRAVGCGHRDGFDGHDAARC